VAEPEQFYECRGDGRLLITLVVNWYGLREQNIQDCDTAMAASRMRGQIVADVKNNGQSSGRTGGACSEDIEGLFQLSYKSTGLKMGKTGGYCFSMVAAGLCFLPVMYTLQSHSLD
jgi:hypothetical protein